MNTNSPNYILSNMRHRSGSGYELADSAVIAVCHDSNAFLVR